MLRAIGAFRWFRSPIWWLPASLLALNTLACTIDRWRRVWLRAFHRPVHCPEAATKSATWAAQLQLSSSADPVQAVCDALEQRGFWVRVRVDDDKFTLRGDRNALAPLATLITHGAVLLLVLGVIMSSVLSRREELTLAPQEVVSIQNVSGTASQAGLQMRSERVSVSRYRDGSIAGYDVLVAIVEGGREAARRHIHLNEPATYQGIGFYLQSYDPLGEDHSVTLQVVRDPGYGLIVAAGLLLFLGLTVSFNFPTCHILGRIEPDGQLRLAGHAGRRAWDFEREFHGLVQSLEAL